MSKIPTDQKIRATFLQMLEETPYTQIKISALTKKAGISRGTFYNYYDSIYDVLADVEEQLFENMPETKDPDATLSRKARIHNELITKLAYLQAHVSTLRLLIGNHGDPYFQYQLGRFLKPILNEVSNLSDINQTLLSAALDGARMNILRWWLLHSNQISIEQLADFLTNFIHALIETYQKKED